MTDWRKWALLLGGLISLCGIVVLVGHGGPMVLIFGLLMTVTAAVEPIYGRAQSARPRGDSRPTDECFVDPETGKLIRVWFDPNTGERRYVDERQA